MTDPYAEVFAEELRIEQARRANRAEGKNLERHNTQRETCIDRCAELAREAYALGITEVAITEDFRVNRRTVRRWLGKPKS